MNKNVSNNNLTKDTIITTDYYTGKYFILGTKEFITKKLMNTLIKEKYAVLDRVQWGAEFYVLVKDYNSTDIKEISMNNNVLNNNNENLEGDVEVKVLKFVNGQGNGNSQIL